MRSERKIGWPQTESCRSLPEGLQGLVEKLKVGRAVRYEVASGAIYRLEDRFSDSNETPWQLKEALRRLNGMMSALRACESNWDDLIRLAADPSTLLGMNASFESPIESGSQLDHWIHVALTPERSSGLEDSQLTGQSQFLPYLTAALLGMYRNCHNVVSLFHEMLTPSQWDSLTFRRFGHSNEREQTEKKKMAKELIRKFTKAVNGFHENHKGIPLGASILASIPAEQCIIRGNGCQHVRLEAAAIYAVLSFVEHEKALPTKTEVKHEMKNLGIRIANAIGQPRNRQIDQKSYRDPFALKSAEWTHIWKGAKLNDLSRHTRQTPRNENKKRPSLTLFNLGRQADYDDALLDNTAEVAPI